MTGALRIDAHHHLWSLARGDYGWLTPGLAAIYRDFAPDDLAPLLKAAGVDRTILVQASPTVAETAFLLDLAARSTFVAGVVGWVDFEATDAPAQIAALAAQPKLKGLRPMIQDMDDDSWMLRHDLAPAIEAMIAAGLTFDALIKPRHLPVLERFAARYPALKIVIDHAAKPDIASGDLTSWARNIHRLGQETWMPCKLSGLVTEGPTPCELEHLRPVVEVLLEAFGSQRLMWGSDWPVLNLNGAYDVWRGAAETLTADLPATDRDWIFGNTAAVFYGLSR